MHILGLEVECMHEKNKHWFFFNKISIKFKEQAYIYSAYDPIRL